MSRPQRRKFVSLRAQAYGGPRAPAGIPAPQPHRAARRVGRILPCRDGPFRESLARQSNEVASEKAVEGLDGRGARQDKRPERCMPRERGFDDQRLSHGERHGKGIQYPLSHGGVLHQGEDPTVKRSGLVRRSMLVRWPRQSREMVDQMGAGRGDQSAEPQHGPERRDLPAAPVGPWQESARLPSIVCARLLHWRGFGRPHRVHQRGRAAGPL